MSKRILFIVGALAVIALGYLGVRGYPPVDQGAVGTVGAAKRYESEQIATKDVNLQNPQLQEFMQSDAFHSLMANPEAVKVLRSETFQQALASPSFKDFKDLLYNKDYKDLLDRKDFKDLLDRKDFKDLLDRKDFKDLLDSKDFKDRLDSKDFKDARDGR